MCKSHQEESLQNFFVQRFKTCVISRGGSYKERAGIDCKRHTSAICYKVSTLCGLHFSALVHMTGSRTFVIIKKAMVNILCR